MGLDMYLNGDKYLPTDWVHPENTTKEDGFRLKGKILELGYWRKQPDLHGFIVDTFADGVDECQEIYLNVGMMRQIIDAVKGKQLPTTAGFFFGSHDYGQKRPSAPSRYSRTPSRGSKMNPTARGAPSFTRRHGKPPAGI